MRMDGRTYRHDEDNSIFEILRRRLKSESSFLSTAPRFPKENCILKGSQASTFCPSGKNMYTEMSMEHWWNDADRGKSKYPEENLS